MNSLLGLKPAWKENHRSEDRHIMQQLILYHFAPVVNLDASRDTHLPEGTVGFVCDNYDEAALAWPIVSFVRTTRRSKCKQDT